MNITITSPIDGSENALRKALAMAAPSLVIQSCPASRSAEGVTLLIETDRSLTEQESVAIREEFLKALLVIS
jgi:hypothetical protein